MDYKRRDAIMMAGQQKWTQNKRGARGNRETHRRSDKIKRTKRRKWQRCKKYMKKREYKT